MEIGGNLEADAAQFSAFVSYSHADAAIAKKLHRKIETYKLPKLLRAIGPGGKESGRSDGRLGQIFRDREDLPAALDLSESVKAALAQSRALIVLCSPHAKDSPWVAKEIELFRELHPDRPILAALIDGEPDEAFPPALLLGGEPLAADLRKSGDGWRLGLLKLVAGVAEVPLDALVQRDSQRHIRSVMTVTLVVGVALLAMIGMTTYAIQQRNAAQYQQAQAEGLVEYMLTDLRDQMEDVGRLDVMTNVNERAMKYYESQGDLTALSSDSLIRRSLILRKMGEDEAKTVEKYGAALEKLQEAHRTTAALLKEDPHNPKYILAHLQSKNWRGYYTDYRGKLRVALDGYHRSKKLSDQLVALKFDDPERIRQLSFLHGNLCIAYLSQKNPEISSALPHCKQSWESAIQISELVPDDSGIQMDLAIRSAWYGEALLSSGKIEEGLAYLREHLTVVDKLVAAEPENIHWRGQQASSYMGMAEQFSKYGSVDDAERFAASAAKMFARLISHDKTNMEWTSSLKRLNELEIGGS